MTSQDLRNEPDSVFVALQGALAQVFAGLARARSEVEHLEACAPCLRALNVRHAELLGVDGSAHEQLAAWRSEDAAGPASAAALDLSEGTWRQGAVYLGRHAIVPLRCDADELVFGALRLEFADATELSAGQREALTVVADGLAAFLTARRVVLRQREALRNADRQQATLEAVIDCLPIGIFLAEAGTGTPTLVNRVGVELLGRGVDPNARQETYSEDYQCVRLDSDELLPNDELPLVRTLITGERHTKMFGILHPDGKRVTIEVTAAPIRDRQGTMFAAVAVIIDFTERNRLEAERAEYRDELIKAQAQALAERSTPLIPLSDEIVAMPLVGTLDRERADQVVETLLTGCAARKARVAILDVTGVPHADTAVAASLLRAAAAVRLLGVEPVLTGIRPDVARALVGLDVDLKSLVTLSTLQDAILYATRTARR
ncbi:STAS domain-containing protein [Nannocystis pusilla]|uniref:STAS domain-containing protein n=1 Tax=Nannocystis pusilla TaxID=889268 RepID=A0ABS7TWV1_9BACT|nr:STAS domain-containing protein [Nannocystis pusilla]MBZ5712738.1 STAS domain-containing protein [Nannocystis pusilla]